MNRCLDLCVTAVYQRLGKGLGPHFNAPPPAKIGHQFRLGREKTYYLHGPANGGPASLTFTVQSQRHVNIDIVQKPAN